jgi:ferredoxin-NADP reductase
MSMLRYIDDRCLATPVTLLYSVRSRDDVIFGDELARLGQRLRNFRLVIVPSRPDAAWDGPRGRLSRDLVAARVDELGTSTFFLCGPPPFMETVQEILHSLDVGPERIRRESFGAGAAIGDPAATVQPSGGTVEFVRSGTRCPAAPGQTLLQVAEAHGVGIPSGCRQGRCGTCTTKLLDGDVEMAIEEGLDPRAKTDGYVLTCVARPRGRVRVDA